MRKLNPINWFIILKKILKTNLYHKIEDSSTALEFFDEGASLSKFFVPAHDAISSFSFLGVQFNNNGHITKVTVTHDGFLEEGTKDVSDVGIRDLIVIDDFIYSEPVVE